MSDKMLYGVLRMPYEMAMADELSRLQFYQRAQEAADRLEAAEARNAAVPAAPAGQHDAPTAMPEQQPSGAVYGIIDPDYGRIYTMVRKLAWEEGYAIGLHGSFTRDLDLVAVPWEAGRRCNPQKLVNRILQATGLKEAHGNPGSKPHGRLVWTLLLPEFGDPRFVDLSIMPAAAGPARQGGETKKNPADAESAEGGAVLSESIARSATAEQAGDAEDAARWRFRKQFLGQGGSIHFGSFGCQLRKPGGVLVSNGKTEEQAIDAAIATTKKGE